jgi:hypothetical protein
LLWAAQKRRILSNALRTATSFRHFRHLDVADSAYGAGKINLNHVAVLDFIIVPTFVNKAVLTPVDRSVWLGLKERRLQGPKFALGGAEARST